MNGLAHTLQKVAQRKARVRSKVYGTADRPRLSVFVSNRHITAQVINDDTRVTIAYVSTTGLKTTGSMTEKAAVIGELIAKAALKAKIKKVVFDRNGRIYHGRVKALADAARKAGLEF
ncbi:MAG TPA: 50S ribosomal protein L18 [Candidatus Saccharibacteria bacterium]|nr:50S ribosomal protein L18 [Candidatus Saccharibacteria bacterium]